MAAAGPTYSGDNVGNQRQCHPVGYWAGASEERSTVEVPGYRAEFKILVQTCVALTFSARGRKIITWVRRPGGIRIEFSYVTPEIARANYIVWIYQTKGESPFLVCP
jgi:hypothetical protein